jgi:hypothetical protein
VLDDMKSKKCWYPRSKGKGSKNILNNNVHMYSEFGDVH